MEPADEVSFREAVALVRSQIDGGAPPSAVVAALEGFWRSRGITATEGLLVRLGIDALGLTIADLKEACAHWSGFPTAAPGPGLDAFLGPRIAAARPHRAKRIERSAPLKPDAAIAWLSACGAHPWLVRHHELVLEAAEEITRALGAELMLAFDRDDVLLGSCA